MVIGIPELSALNLVMNEIVIYWSLIYHIVSCMVQR